MDSFNCSCFQNENYTSTILPNMNSTLSADSNFLDIIANPYFYSSIITFIILLLCLLFFVLIQKS